MYFPYLRGRQYELLVLRELAEENLLGMHVIPIIEPVKISPTFMSTMEAFAKAEQKIALIFNPEVGDLAGKKQKTVNDLRIFLEGGKVVPSIIVNTSALECLRELQIASGNILTILDNGDFLKTYEAVFGSDSPLFTLFPDDRRIRRVVRENKILFEDKFQKKPRNADYPEDEFLSDDHLYYIEEGYQGFGDYSIVGNEFTESAFAPRAVAIHIAYFDKDNALRIRHFISDSNEGISDVAGKFAEAVSKLAAWYKNVEPKPFTRGLQTLLRHYANGTYPGLPTLKKLSIMHHLELIGQFLNEVEAK
ncbi:MAG: sce7725 family protein [Synergistaceae bacterium]|jgi:hypothetical protein|nr:sce7725 family protein [Synergistaceae bacterium]